MRSFGCYFNLNIVKGKTYQEILKIFKVLNIRNKLKCFDTNPSRDRFECIHPYLY